MDVIAIKYNIKYNSKVYETIFCGDRSDADRDYKYHGYIIESVKTVICQKERSLI